MDNKKVASLLNKGIKFETLKMLNETQIDTLYTAVIGEQESLTDKVDDVQQMKAELSQLNQAIDQTIQKIGEEENEDGLEDLARQDYTGQEGPHDEKDMAPDGMDDDSDNNRQMMGEVEEVNPWAICTSSLGLEGRERDSYSKSESAKFERCVRDVKKQNEIRQIEESIVSLVKKYVPMTMSKKDLLEQIPGTKEAPVKTPTRTKPERKTPYKPKHKPAPKAGDTTTAPSRVKPGTKEKPGRKTPYQPKHKPAPKAGKKGLPEFLKFNTLNIQFRDEQKN
jgi:hypothetical protein